MKTKLIFSAISLLLPLLLQNDNAPRAYIFSSLIEENYSKDTTSFAYFKSSWEYSFIQEYQKALWAFDQVVQSYPNLSEEEKFYFSAFRPINAQDYIVNRAAKEKIIIINEAHHQPMHRTFTTSLLEDLYDKGYHFLGLEALAPQDTSLNSRGYPIISSGFYTQESQFGNMVRKALELGYHVFPYEASGVNGKEREIQQAQNIKKIIDSHPGEKFLIHCGFDHIIENEVPGWGKAMAGRLKEFTGIDPFTINQVILSEHFMQEKENPYFRLVDTLKQNSLFINDDGKLFNGHKNSNQYDVRMFNPRTTYINGRPSWLLMNGERKMYMLDMKTINLEYPIIIQAFLADDRKDAVPLDVIDIQEFSDQRALVLPKGIYNLRIYNTKGDSTMVRTIIQ